MSRVEIDGKELEVSEVQKDEFAAARSKFLAAAIKLKIAGALSEYRNRLNIHIDAYLMNIDELRAGADAETIARINDDLKEFASRFRG